MVYVDERFQFSANGDPKLGHHYGKGEYVCKGFFIKKLQKVNVLELWCGHSIGVHHLCMPLDPLLYHRVGYFVQDYCL